MSVVASLVIGADGSTSPSNLISNGVDREQFLKFRATMDCIITGGNTYRTESYHRTPVPLIVLTHHDFTSDRLINSQALFWNLSLSRAIEKAGAEFGENIHLECGKNLLQEALALQLITHLRLTITDRTGGRDKVEVDYLLSFFTDVEKVLERGNLEIFATKPK